MTLARQASAVPALTRLWAVGLLHPAEAAAQAWRYRQPAWALAVVAGANVVTSLTSLPLAALLGRTPLLQSWLTFMPTENYWLAEALFLPFLRMAVWLLQAAVVHTFLRINGKRSEMDRILTASALANLVLTPFVWLFDWTAIALDLYILPVTAVWHAAVALWGLAISAAGQSRLLGADTRTVVLANALAFLVGTPLLVIFAR